MTRIYMRHEKHGEKIAYLEAEAENDELNGWERFDPNAPQAQDDEIEYKEEELITKPRRGRPRKEV